MMKSVFPGKSMKTLQNKCAPKRQMVGDFFYMERVCHMEKKGTEGWIMTRIVFLENF